MAKRHINRTGDLQSLFLHLEELLLANSGADEFEEIFKLLIAKLHDERTGQAPRFSTYSDENETYRQVSDLLKQAETAWPGILGPSLIPALRPAHLQVCVQALQKHRISDTTLSVMDNFFEFLVSRSAKGAKGQYFTPRHVVDLCVRILRPQPHETVLDPACGSGGFLIHTLNFVRGQSTLNSAATLTKYCTRHLWGFDIDMRAVRVAKALMVLAGDGSANIIRLNSLLTPQTGGLFPVEDGGTRNDPQSLLTIEDVCRSRLRGHKGFDVILTNPPFAGEVRESSFLNEYALARDKPRVERDILFLERCIQLLRPGGRLGIVLPHNKFAVSSYSYVREWLLRKARVLAVVGLGRHTFLPHTHQKASVLFAKKRVPGDTVSPNSKIFFGISERDGKNSKGQLLLRPSSTDNDSAWTSVDHDFEEIVTAFHRFCKSESLLLEA